jgi:hypothetical protein
MRQWLTLNRRLTTGCSGGRSAPPLMPSAFGDDGAPGALREDLDLRSLTTRAVREYARLRVQSGVRKGGLSVPASNDEMGVSGASTTDNGPGALLRGGNFTDGPSAGPLAVRGYFQPSFSGTAIGFRCAR